MRLVLRSGIRWSRLPAALAVAVVLWCVLIFATVRLVRG